MKNTSTFHNPHPLSLPLLIKIYHLSKIKFPCSTLVPFYKIMKVGIRRGTLNQALVPNREISENITSENRLHKPNHDYICSIIKPYLRKKV